MSDKINRIPFDEELAEPGRLIGERKATWAECSYASNGSCALRFIAERRGVNGDGTWGELDKEVSPAKILRLHV